MTDFEPEARLCLNLDGHQDRLFPEGLQLLGFLKQLLYRFEGKAYFLADSLYLFLCEPSHSPSGEDMCRNSRLNPFEPDE